VDYLDSGVITAQAGGDRLAELPRKLRGGASYTDHPLAIRCPSNQTGDESSDVTYALRGHYVSFDATVRPYYPTSADQRSATYVYAIAGITQRDGDLSTAIVGQQLRASPTTPAAMSADVDGAQELTLRVKCSDPDGIVVLTDARLTVAG
jgi:hypothetical protein